MHRNVSWHTSGGRRYTSRHSIQSSRTGHWRINDQGRVLAHRTVHELGEQAGRAGNHASPRPLSIAGERRGAHVSHCLVVHGAIPHLPSPIPRRASTVPSQQLMAAANNRRSRGMENSWYRGTRWSTNPVNPRRICWLWLSASGLP